MVDLREMMLNRRPRARKPQAPVRITPSAEVSRR
jgi:hypothetical protein